MNTRGYSAKSPQWWQRHYPPCTHRRQLNDVLTEGTIKNIAYHMHVPVEWVAATKLCMLITKDLQVAPNPCPAHRLALCWYVLWLNRCPMQPKLIETVAL